MMENPRGRGLILLAGPSGVGKDAVLGELRLNRPDIHIPVTVTTRPPRDGEEDGREYRFLSEEEFESRDRNGEFLETATVHGFQYGTPRDEVEGPLRSGRKVILKIDVQGARTMRRIYPEATGIFILPQGMEQLRRRLEERGQPDLETRMENAHTELRRSLEFRHRVVNREGDLPQTVRKVEDIIGTRDPS